MNANEVNEVINNICEKIGIGVSNAKEFIPALTKYQIVHNALWGGFWVIISICLIMFMRYLRHSYAKEDYSDPELYGVGMIVSVILVILVTPIAASFIFSMVEWIASPEVQAVRYILELVK